MGLLDGLFGKKDPAAEVKKLVTKSMQKYGDPSIRQEALHKLAAMDTPEAITGLLQRFTVRVEPGITDDEEKQYVYEQLLEAGAKAIEPLKAFVEKSEQPTWALKALEQLLPSSEMVEVILQALEKEGPDWTRDPEKKITLLRYLGHVQDARIAPRLIPFLSDVNEDVRFAAVSAVVDQAKDDTLREPLVQTLLAAHEGHSERMRRHAAEALVTTQHSVKGHTPAVQAALPPGFTVDKEGFVKAAGK